MPLFRRSKPSSEDFPWPSGTYLLPDHVAAIAANAADTGGHTVLVPVFIPRATQLASVGLYVKTLGDAAARIRCAIFSAHADAQGLPKALLIDGGEADVGSGSVNVIRDFWPMSIMLQRGKHWVQFQVKATTTTPVVNRISVATRYIPGTTAAEAAFTRYHTMTHAYGAPVTPHVAALTASLGSNGFLPYLKAA